MELLGEIDMTVTTLFWIVFGSIFGTYAVVLAVSFIEAYRIGGLDACDELMRELG